MVNVGLLYMIWDWLLQGVKKCEMLSCDQMISDILWYFFLYAVEVATMQQQFFKANPANFFDNFKIRKKSVLGALPEIC